MANGDTHAVARHAVELQSQKNVARVTQVVRDADHDHRDAGEVGHLAYIFNAQWKNLAVSILYVRTEGIRALARQQFEVHGKDADSGAVVGAEIDGGSERKRLGLHGD